jgi:hypothetical protein
MGIVQTSGDNDYGTHFTLVGEIGFCNEDQAHFDEIHLVAT